MYKVFFASILFSSLAFAHGMNLFVTHDKNVVDIYAYFASGNACKECKLIIKNENTILLESKLNKEGKYKYSSAVKMLDISIEASDGHHASKKITLDDNDLSIKDK